MIVKRKAGAAALLIGGIVLAGPALAQSTDCFSFGYGSSRLDAGSVSLGRINDVSPRVNFVKRSDLLGCPNASAACRDKAYLVPGDEVVVLSSGSEFVCAVYANRKGQVTDGWLPRSAVTTIATKPEIRLSDWIGTWKSGPEQEVVIEVDAPSDRLKIHGDASWGASDPKRVEIGAVNVGRIEGDVKADGAMASFGMGENGTVPFDKADDSDCKVQMMRLGPYLLVKDNSMCGGMNVSFTGVYSRVK